jgi:hypothetical protein
MKTTNGEDPSIDQNSLGSLWIGFFLMTDDNSMAFRQEHQYTHKILTQ